MRTLRSYTLYGLLSTEVEIMQYFYKNSQKNYFSNKMVWKCSIWILWLFIFRNIVISDYIVLNNKDLSVKKIYLIKSGLSI